MENLFYSFQMYVFCQNEKNKQQKRKINKKKNLTKRSPCSIILLTEENRTVKFAISMARKKAACKIAKSLTAD